MRRASLVAVQLRQADVEQHHVGPELARPPRSASRPSWAVRTSWPMSSSSMARLSAASRLSSTTRMRSGAPERPRSRPGRRGGAASAAPRPATGRRTVNSLPRPGPSLWRVDRAAVHLDQPLDQRQADAQAALRALERAVHLGEHLEDRAAASRAGMPMPVSRTVIAASPALPLGGATAMCPPRSVYLAALLSRFENTCASRVGSASTKTGSRRQRHRQLVAAGARCSGRLVSTAASHHRRQLDPLLAQLELAAGDAARRRAGRRSAGPSAASWRSITSRAHARLRSRRRPAGCRICSGVADRGQRVAQLVGQRRQELVLRRSASRSASSACLRSLMSTRTFTAPSERPGLVADRVGVGQDGEAAAVGPLDDDLVPVVLLVRLQRQRHPALVVADRRAVGGEELERAAEAVLGVVELAARAPRARPPAG